MNEHPFVTALGQIPAAARVGHVHVVAPGHVEASGPLVGVGDLCEIETSDGAASAEVAAVGETGIVLIPLEPEVLIAPHARVIARSGRARASVGVGFAGRAIDALATPIDGGRAVLADAQAPLQGRVLAPLERRSSDRIAETGVRAIDALFTLAQGQRIGIFAASGVGKTSLVNDLAFNMECDRCVICLVGERGREVEALWRALSSRQDLDRFSLVAATSDRSAPVRVRAAYQALALAEFFRDRGEHVLFIMDSVTRFAMALREIGLAAGAPPTLRAYTPNVFAALPRIVERCGASRSDGAITAIMTVLAETDDVDDPIAEVMKSLLDGHIVLSRQLAEQGHFPAIDPLRSVSRQALELMSPTHRSGARRAIELLSAYEEARLMIESGVHRSGANARIDEAIAARDALLSFLKQSRGERTSLAETLNGLARATRRLVHA